MVHPIQRHGEMSNIDSVMNNGYVCVGSFVHYLLTPTERDTERSEWTSKVTGDSIFHSLR